MDITLEEDNQSNLQFAGTLFGNVLTREKTTKHNHEFQEVCEDLQKDFGKLVWTLPYKVGITETKLRRAGEIARKRGILKFNYLVGVIKNLP